jgi:hypothetical protein
MDFDIGDPALLARSQYKRKRSGNEGDDGSKYANGSSDWAEPIPLVTEPQKERPYPIEYLPKIMKEAIEEYHAYGQQPISLIASSALASTSLVTQGLVDVARDSELIGPISLNLIVIAVSGERSRLISRLRRCLRAPIPVSVGA